MKYSAYTNVGGRNNNEDYFEAVRANGCCLFVLCDGLGGLDAGEVASETAAAEIKDQFLFDPKGFELKQAVLAANERILMKQKESGKNMKTTVTAVYIADGEIYCSHVGDSRIYMFDEGGICYQSVDHSASQMAVFSGEITPDGIRTHPDRNILTNALGAYNKLNAEVKSFSADKIKAVLMCSDGFWEYVYEDEMVKLLNESQEPSEWIVSMRALLGQRIGKKNDNNTAVAVFLKN